MIRIKIKRRIDCFKADFSYLRFGFRWELVLVIDNNTVHR